MFATKWGGDKADSLRSLEFQTYQAWKWWPWVCLRWLPCHKLGLWRILCLGSLREKRFLPWIHLGSRNVMLVSQASFVLSWFPGFPVRHYSRILWLSLGLWVLTTFSGCLIPWRFLATASSWHKRPWFGIVHLVCVHIHTICILVRKVAHWSCGYDTYRFFLGV